jgi:hypothetical protein
MKKITLLFLGIAALTLNAKAQTTIFKETFGTTQLTRGTCTSVTVPGIAEAGKYDPQKNEFFTDHIWSADSHVWNAGIAYSQTSDAISKPSACDSAGTTVNIRTNNPSTFTGASGDGNLYFNASVNNSFTVTGINTSAYDNVTLSFGIYGKNTSDVTLLKLQYDSGSGLTDLGVTQISALSTKKATWLTVTGLNLPTATNLSLTFSSPNLNSANKSLPLEIRIDDILITGTATATLVKTLNQDNRKVTAFNSTIKLDGFTSGIVEIFNAQGKRVYSSVLKESIEPQLAKGLYIVKVGDFRQKISL